MNTAKYSTFLTLLATGSLMVACSDSFEDAPSGTAGTQADGGAGSGGEAGVAGTGGGSAGTSATGGSAGEAGSGGTQAGGYGGADAGTGGTAGDAGTGGTAGDAGTGGVGGDDAGTDGSAGDAGQDASPCPTGFGDCDGDDTNGCETPVDTLENCGGCDNVCGDVDNANASCDNQVCTFVCTGAYDDCDGDEANGCETDVTSDPANCGSCGDTCPSGGHGIPTCSNAACGIDCATSWEDCDGQLSNGCEIDLSSDPSNCGSCNSACPTRPHATPTCDGSQCGFACDNGWADCNGNASDGCEVNLNTDASNCAGCGQQCGTAHGTPTCSGGTCSIQCHTDYGDCDGGNANGCETSLTTAVNCGTCGRDCLGGGCASSQCTAWPLVNLPHADWAGDLAVNSTHIFWANGSAAYRAPIAGGSPEIMGVTEMATSLVIDDVDLYWSTYKSNNTGGVYRSALSAPGGVDVFAQYQSMSMGLAVDDLSVYWGVQDGLRKLSKTGATPTDLVSGYTNVWSIALDANNVYFVSRSSAGKVARVSKSGGAVTDLMSNQHVPGALVVDADSVYFVKGSGELVKVGKNGSGATVLASGYGSPAALDIDDAHVFFTNGAGGLVVQVPKVSGAAVTRHDGGMPTSVKVANGIVYWYDPLEDHINAMVK
jgi:Domain of unknown function (DUF5050)